MTGVQTCALPIWERERERGRETWGRNQERGRNRNIARGGLDPGHDLRQVGEAGAGEGEHLRGGVGEALGVVWGLGETQRGLGAGDVWSEWPRRRRRAQAYVCTAALVKICRPSVREHLFNDVAPAPAPKHGLPVLVAHILQETRGLGPCLQPPGVFFSASSSLLIPILPAPALAPQKPDVLEELAFEIGRAHV